MKENFFVLALSIFLSNFVFERRGVRCRGNECLSSEQYHKKKDLLIQNIWKINSFCTREKQNAETLKILKELGKLAELDEHNLLKRILDPNLSLTLKCYHGLTIIKPKEVQLGQNPNSWVVQVIRVNSPPLMGVNASPIGYHPANYLKQSMKIELDGSSKTVHVETNLFEVDENSYLLAPSAAFWEHVTEKEIISTCNFKKDGVIPTINELVRNSCIVVVKKNKGNYASCYEKTSSDIDSDIIVMVVKFLPRASSFPDYRQQPGDTSQPGVDFFSNWRMNDSFIYSATPVSPPQDQTRQEYEPYANSKSPWYNSYANHPNPVNTQQANQLYDLHLNRPSLEYGGQLTQASTGYNPHPTSHLSPGYG